MQEEKKVIYSASRKVLLNMVLSLLGICLLVRIWSAADDLLFQIIIGIPMICCIIWMVSHSLPVFITIGQDGIWYQALFGKKRFVKYNKMRRLKNNIKVYAINFIPIYTYTDYALYIEDDRGKKKKLCMSTLSKDNFHLIIGLFLRYGGAAKKRDMVGYVYDNSYFGKKIIVPYKKLKESYNYIAKRVCLVFFAFLIIFQFISMIKSQYSDSKEIVIEIFVTLIFNFILFLIIRFLFRKELAVPKNIPKEVYLCSNYIQFDEERFEFNKISDGYIVPAEFYCDRMISFQYEEQEIEIKFGKYRNFFPELFKEYEIITDFLVEKGFVRMIYNK